MRWSWLNQMPYAAVPTTPTASALADATQSASRPNCAGDAANAGSTARLTPVSGSAAPDFGSSARLDIAAFSEFFRLTIQHALIRRLHHNFSVQPPEQCNPLIERRQLAMRSSGARDRGGNTRMKTLSPGDRSVQVFCPR